MANGLLRATLALAVLGSVCGGLLAVSYQATEPHIDSNRRAASQRLVGELLGDTPSRGIELPTVELNPTGECDSYLLHKVVEQGYAGGIELLALWRGKSGEVSMRVLNHRETPGIGDFIDHQRSDWLSNLDNSRQTQYETLDNVSGATITTAAIARAALAIFNKSSMHCDG